ncbi:uncharacterized protein N7496_000090 [Penicillium cataractarum]|uniref:FHA domain-containing protein n=1 Tax=Penicillium cataractarum TaxID=2100454 RepID=A0A9W9VTA6_9EURO|nr:uncharacterized protein N7496_000090 [Penicillium cataractarum]KAJ5389022.1 hypothetical protein N7496_000090 [Penicillium cataractarum]
MWILDSAGDFLSGKRLWLRPGKQYLFGRILVDDVRHAIPNKSISRKHMLIEVSSVEPRDGTRTHSRTKISITDLDSSRGTVVNGEKIKGKHALAGDEHSILLGHYPHALRIKWQPVVLSFSFSSKEMRVEDPLAKVRARLESLDIKTIIPYLVGQTTHVVQSKRNTAKGLQALINGKYIVQNSYIDALVYATTPSDLENDASASPLEIDFDSAWPDPTEHLPPAGNEPISRPAAAFAPNPSRLNVFEGYTFVFGDPSQFENLQAAINNGQGKALIYQIKDGETTAEEIVQFMRSAAGHKGVGAEREEAGGVVLVRFRSKGEFEPWSIDLGNEVALMTDQRVIEQREFLDAILGNDASPLCRPLPREEGETQTSTPAVPEPSRKPSTDQPVSVSPPSEEAAPATTQRPAPRARKYVSKMKAFDDGFDMESVPVYTPDDDGQDIPATQAMDLEPIQPDEPSQAVSTVEDQEENDAVADLLPGARAMKRRRAEMGEDRQGSIDARVKSEATPKPKRAKLDVREAARKHRQEEEEEQQRQAEEDRHLSQDVDVEKLRNLAIVEEMDIPVREPVVREHENSDRWDDRWNGRKNFKRFRRKGEPLHARQRIQSVIVPLEEVTRKDFGIGEHYWVSTNKTPEVSQSTDHEDRELRQPSTREDRAASRSEVSIQPSATPDPAPESQSAPSRSRSQKRPRETRGSDSDEEPRFRFRRKR